MLTIRLAHARDRDACLALDDSFETENVWQMDERVAAEQISIGFRVTRLPRPMRVRDLELREMLAASFERGEAIFVADDGAVRGYLLVTPAHVSATAYVKAIVVANAFRRQGIGKQLLGAAYEWAGKQKLRALMLHTTTKAYPAIRFFQKQGFGFCGFNDRLLPNGDIALYFALAVRA
ncbi:MAG: GNAT family N-acetyltransferase [Chloroflexi bacterium]|nr:GNAT family N-acetyltransferase [Chloroflexota bacterium]